MVDLACSSLRTGHANGISKFSTRIHRMGEMAGMYSNHKVKDTLYLSDRLNLNKFQNWGGMLFMESNLCDINSSFGIIRII